MMNTVDSNLALTAQPSAPDDRATDFKAVEGTTGEQYDGYTLMVEAYAAIWLVLMAWLFFIWRRQADLTSRLDGLEGAISRAESKAAGGSRPRERTASSEARAEAKAAAPEKSA